MSGGPRVIAVDLGAGSIRVASVDLGAAVPVVEVLHRWQNTPLRAADGSLRWNWPRIMSEVEAGLTKALASGSVASIGVDGWGVDYGLVDRSGELISLPFSYRDSRTDVWREVGDAIGLERIYGITGIQLMPINTIFQLAVHPREELDRADTMLLLPDLMVRALTGAEMAERSNASTTALLDVADGTWSRELIEHVALPPEIFSEVVDAARPAESWNGVPVTIVGSHDTASAFLGMPGPAGPGTVFVSSGTWVLVGVEREAADTSEASRAANFSNERGALGGFRFLKNLTGFWMLEQCRPAWGSPPVQDLVAEAEDYSDPVPLIDATDARFLAPKSMLREVVEAAGLEREPTRGAVVRCILESIASGVARVVDELSVITGTEMRRVCVVGGSSRVRLLNELIAFHTKLPVVVGSSEATALGNAVAQGLGIGYFAGLDEARGWLKATGTVLEPM